MAALGFKPRLLRGEDRKDNNLGKKVLQTEEGQGEGDVNSTACKGPLNPKVHVSMHADIFLTQTSVP